jgi:hypothetical protein
VRSGGRKGPDVVIGVIGPGDVVERILLLGRSPRSVEGPSWRLVGASYRTESEAPGKTAKLQDSVDVLLFTGPLPYDIVHEAGALSVPATFVPMSGASLFSTMLRTVLEHDVDLTRVSIDSLARADVMEAYAELGLPTRRVRVKSYDGPASAASFAEWHESLHRQKRTSAAFTTVRSVARRVERAGVPVFRVIPAVASFRVALSTAALLGSGSRLEDAQIAVGLVRLPAIGEGTTSLGWQHEMRLAVHQVLLREARAAGATVLPRDERSYFVATTLGSLSRATEDFRVAPFVAAVAEAVGLHVDVGLGLGSTALEAEERAAQAVDRASRDATTSCCVIKPDGTVLELPVQLHERPRTLSPGRAKGLGVVAQISESLEAIGKVDRPPVVDAELAATALGVSARTARRMLGDLVEEGLAWPLPTPTGARRGRPRKFFRLVTPDSDASIRPERESRVRAR